MEDSQGSMFDEQFYRNWYIDLIKQKYSERFQGNAKYSLRSFSKDLRITPSHLSQLLNGKINISPRTADFISSELSLTPRETEIFKLCVTASGGRSKTQRQLAQTNVKVLLQQEDESPLKLDLFQVISEWHYPAIVEAINHKDFNQTPEWIAAQLGLELEIVNESLKQLQNVGLLSFQDCKWSVNSEVTVVNQNVPCEYVRKFHKQMLNKAAQAIDVQPRENRMYMNSVMGFSRKYLKEARAELEKFQIDFSKKYYSHQGDTDCVYACGAYLFELTQSK